MKSPKNLLKSDLPYLLFLFFAILIFFSHYLSGTNLFFATDEASSDLLDFNYPQRVYLSQQLKQNKIPLWTPYQQNGFPFLAEAQTGVFFLPNLVLFKFLEPPLAFNWSIILSFFILSTGMYFYLKALHLGWPAALFGSLVLTFSGFYITHLKHVPLLQAAVFFPWTLLFIEKILTSSRLKYSLALGVTFALSILAGHLPTAYSLLLFSLFYFLLRLAEEFQKQGGETTKPIILFFLSLALAFGLCAVQILPTLEMIPYSTRSLPLSANTGFSLPWDTFLSFLNPYQFGSPGLGNYPANRFNFWEVTGYVGIVPLILAILGLASKIVHGRVFKTLLLISIILSFGLPKEIFQPLWNFIPGLTFTRVPSRFLLFTDIFLVVLAANIFKKILDRFPQEGKAAAVILFGITLFDLFWAFSSYYGSIPAKLWQQPPQSVRFLQSDPDYFRVTNIGQQLLYTTATSIANGWHDNNNIYLSARETLPPTLNSLFRINSIHYQYEYTGAFSLARRTQLSALTQDEGISEKYAPKILGMQNVKYVLSMVNLPSSAMAAFTPVFVATVSAVVPPITIFQNPQFLPRAYLVRDAAVLNPDEILPFMTSDSFHPAQQVILEENVALPNQTDSNVSDSVKFLGHDEVNTTLAVEASTSAYLVLADSFFPGWQAVVDGRPQKIFRANSAFEAIPLPAGKHLVTFSYHPAVFYWGAGISFFTLIGLLLIILVDRFNIVHRFFYPLIKSHRRAPTKAA